LPLATDYPFLDIFWSMIIFFAWVAWIWVAITIFADIFRRHDIGGWGKAGWIVLVILLPFLGVLIYLIANHDEMAQRSMREAETQKHAMDTYIRETAGGSAVEIAKAKELLDQGTISQAEFEEIKRKALATA
jgi:hypothetical protein